MAFLKRTPRWLAVLGLLAGFLSTPASKGDEKVQWQDVDQPCGQLQLEVSKKKTIVVEGRTESRFYTAYLQDATITLYPAAFAEAECCSANPIATAHSGKYGTFAFKGVQPGYYWLRVQKNGVTRVIPVHLMGTFSDKACSDLSVRRSFIVDATPPKIETRIR